MPRCYAQPPVLIHVDLARQVIATGDLLLFRHYGSLSYLVSAFGRSLYHHCGLAIQINNSLIACIHTRGFTGVRLSMLSRLVRAWPKRIDWFQANADQRWPNWNGAKAAEKALSLLGRHYGYRSFLLAAMHHIPIVRLLMPRPTDDLTLTSWPPHCAQLVAWASREGGGVDPVPHLSDYATEPADLARSPFYAYRGTLVS